VRPTGRRIRGPFRRLWVLLALKSGRAVLHSNAAGQDKLSQAERQFKPCVNLTATSLSYGKAKNSTPTESKLLTRLRYNLARLIMSARRPPMQNFMQIRPQGASG